MKNKRYSVKQHRSQRGVVLAVSLIMLVLITLLAVSAMRSTIMEERMASNSRNDNIAFQLAETALRQAETNLNAAPLAQFILNASAQTVGLGTCEIILDNENFSDQARWDAIACDYVGDADIDAYGNDIARTPHYFIEFVRAEPQTNLSGGVVPVDCFYRITAKGYGPDVNSAVMLQTTFKFDACT